MKKFALGAALGMSLLAGCSATIPTQSGGVIEKNPGKKVEASVSSFNFLGFNPMHLAESETVLTELQKKCAGDKVTGISALVVRTWLVIGVNERYEVSGYCS